MKSNTEQLKIATKYLGESCPKCCSMSNNCCCYFVSKIFKDADNASLFYGGKTVTYCPNAIKWCKTQLAQIPPFLAMPSDIIFFDWELNGVPNHIGFVANRVSDQVVHTLEGNTTSKYVVAYRNREAKYIQGIFRPHFKATYDTSKALVIDGQFDYNSIAMLQKALGIKVDGILGRDTVKALQKRVGATQDGSWGVATSKAVQKMVGTTVDGAFGEKSVKALQTWINKQVGKTTTTTDKTATTEPQSSVAVSDGKLAVNGIIEKKTVERMQEFFGTTKDGIISGQKEDLWKKYFASFSKTVLGFSGKGSECVKKLQKWLGVTEDGILGVNTVKAWQKKLGVTVDGSFGTNSAKAWQKYLNENDKAVYPQTTQQDKVIAVAKKLIAGKFKYVKYDANNLRPTNGGNCIRFVGLCLKDSGIKVSDSAQGILNNAFAEKLLKASEADALKLWEQRNGDGWKIIKSNSGIAESKLEEADVLIGFSGSTYKHTALKGESEYVYDCTSGSGASRRQFSKFGSTVKIAFRCVGKKTTADKIYDQIVRLAWASGTDSKKWLYETGAPTEAYKEALKAEMGYTSKVARSDCGYFISVLARLVGSDDFLMLGDPKKAFPKIPSDYETVFKGKQVPDGFLKKSDFVRYKKTNGGQHTYAVVDSNHIAEAGRKYRFPVIRKMAANSKCNANGVKHDTIEVIRAK